MKNIIHLALCAHLLAACNIIPGESNVDSDLFKNPNLNKSLYEGLIDFWSFDEPSNGNRISYNNLILSDINSNAARINGINGGGVNCSAAIDVILENTNVDYSMDATDDFSLAFWARQVQPPPATGPHYITHTNGSLSIQVGDFDGGNDDTDIELQWGNNTYQFLDVMSRGGSDFEHFTFVVDQTSLSVTLYKNGAYYGVITIAVSSFTITDFTICNHPLGESNFLGELDSFGMWSRQLTQSEISELATGTTSLDY
jgi:hypothetical protein